MWNHVKLFLLCLGKSSAVLMFCLLFFILVLKTLIFTIKSQFPKERDSRFVWYNIHNIQVIKTLLVCWWWISYFTRKKNCRISTILLIQHEFPNIWYMFYFHHEFAVALARLQKTQNLGVLCSRQISTWIITKVKQKSPPTILIHWLY